MKKLSRLIVTFVAVTSCSILHATWIQTIENKTPYTARVSAAWDLQQPITFDLGSGSSRSFNATDQELKYIRASIQKPYQKPGAQSGYAGDTDNAYETPYKGSGTWTIVGPFKDPHVGVETWAAQDHLNDEQFEVVRTQ